MAAPARTPAQIASLIHNSNVGQSAQGWTLTAKTTEWTMGDRLLVFVVVSRQSNAWSSYYTTQADGTLGKVYFVVDSEGRYWLPNIAAGSWADGGLRGGG